MRRVLCAVAFCLSCGDGEDDTGIVGRWGAMVGDCAVVWEFRADGEYAYGQACELSSGEIGLEAWVGDYELADGAISLIATRSSCRGSVASASGTWTVDGGQLVLTLEGVGSVLDPVQDIGASGTAVYGCYSDDGTEFTRQPVAPLN